MLALLLCWTNANVTLATEGDLLRVESTLKRMSPLRYWHPSPYSADDLLLVDVADDKSVQLDTLKAKNTLITDPRLLDTVLRRIAAAGGYRFILCDLSFDIPTPYDDTLLRTLYATPAMGFPVERGYSKDPHIRPLEALPGGVVHYDLTESWWKLSDKLVKFQLRDATGEKSLPLYMAEQVHGPGIAGRGLFRIGNLTFDASVQPDDLRRKNGASAIYTLSDLKTLTQYNSLAETKDLIRNKFILIGDFSNDLHKTAFGDMPGVLILFDIFATITDGGNAVTGGWLAFLLVCFTVISWLTFFRQGSPPFLHRLKAVAEVLMGEVGGTLLLNWAALWTVSILSYFIFNKSTEVIALTFYLSFVDYLRYLWLEKDAFFKQKKKDLKSWFRFIFKVKPSM